MEFLILLIIGMATGVLAGLFGIGGGIIYTPVLFFVFSGSGVASPLLWTIGTSLFCNFAASSSSTIQQIRLQNNHFRVGLWVGIIGIIGVYGGSFITTAAFYTEGVFVAVFVVLLLYISALFFHRSRTENGGTERTAPPKLYEMAAAGTGGGLVAALAGLGGGIIVVPILNLLFKLPISKVVSISSAAVSVISLSGWLRFSLMSSVQEGLTTWSIGYVDFGTGFPLILGAFAGGFAGATISRHVQQEKLQRWFSLFVLVIAAVLIWDTYL
ncbi:MAG: sulfite exporter TauE/SafE family protein [Balneolaceae bacterium]